MMMMMTIMTTTKLLLIIMTMKQTTTTTMMMILISYWNGVNPGAHNINGHSRRLRWYSTVRGVASSCNKFALQKMKMEEQFGSHWRLCPLNSGCKFWKRSAVYKFQFLYVKLIHGFAPCKAIRIPESGKFLPMESRVREIFASGIRIPLTIGIRNPRSTDKNSGIHGVEYRIQDCLGLSYMGGMETLLIIFQSIYSGKSAPMRRLIVAAEFIYFDPWT